MVDLSTNIDNYVKYKWSTYTNQKTGIGSELKKKSPTIFCLQENHFKFNNISRLSDIYIT